MSPPASVSASRTAASTSSSVTATSGTGAWEADLISSGHLRACSMITSSLTRSNPNLSRSRIANFATAARDDLSSARRSSPYGLAATVSVAAR